MDNNLIGKGLIELETKVYTSIKREDLMRVDFFDCAVASAASLIGVFYADMLGKYEVLVLDRLVNSLITCYSNSVLNHCWKITFNRYVLDRQKSWSKNGFLTLIGDYPTLNLEGEKSSLGLIPSLAPEMFFSFINIDGCEMFVLSKSIREGLRVWLIASKGTRLGFLKTAFKEQCQDLPDKDIESVIKRLLDGTIDLNENYAKILIRFLYEQEIFVMSNFILVNDQESSTKLDSFESLKYLVREKSQAEV